jgi:hypothetical protein
VTHPLFSALACMFNVPRHIAPPPPPPNETYGPPCDPPTSKCLRTLRRTEYRDTIAASRCWGSLQFVDSYPWSHNSHVWSTNSLYAKAVRAIQATRPSLSADNNFMHLELSRGPCAVSQFTEMEPVFSSQSIGICIPPASQVSTPRASAIERQ